MNPIVQCPHCLCMVVINPIILSVFVEVARWPSPFPFLFHCVKQRCFLRVAFMHHVSLSLLLQCISQYLECSLLQAWHTDQMQEVHYQYKSVSLIISTMSFIASLFQLRIQSMIPQLELMTTSLQCEQIIWVSFFFFTLILQRFHTVVLKNILQLEFV